jgi:hypothetical protein
VTAAYLRALAVEAEHSTLHARGLAAQARLRGLTVETPTNRDTRKEPQ